MIFISKFVKGLAAAALSALMLAGCDSPLVQISDVKTPPDTTGGGDTTGQYYGRYGRLFAEGNRIVGEKSNGQAVQLKGVSFQWSVSGWGSDRFFIPDAVNAMVDGWNAQVIRAPLGLSFDKGPNHSVSGGYDTHPEENWARVRTVIDAAIARGVYAIVDWHSHTAHEPRETALAIDFFTNPELAGRYGNHPGVIFEIYNEPEGDVEWPVLKDYANTLIKAIRDAGFNNLILVGSNYWDLAVDIAASDPPEDPLDNFAFTFHFYADIHRVDATRWFSPRKPFGQAVLDALDAGFPVFVSEWGTNDATTASPPNFAEADKWHAFLDEHKISSCAWGVTAGDDNVLDFWPMAGSPLLSASTADIANWTNPRWMTPHGRYIYRLLTGRDTTFTIDSDFPEYTGPRTPIALTGQLSFYTNDGGSGEVTLENGIMHTTYALEQGNYEWTPYAGVHFYIDWLAACEYGIGYTYMGDPHRLRIEQRNVTDYGYHANRITVPHTETWTEIAIPWSYFIQPNWSIQIPRDLDEIGAISWYLEAPAGTAGEFSVKDIYCLGTVMVPARQQSRRPVNSGRNQ
jgi:endoglucanase